METVAENIRAKITNAEETTINEEKLYETIKKRKNWTSLGIDAIQNFWWKKLKGTWKSLVKSNTWIDQPDSIPDWITQGRTVLLPKTES